MRELGEVRVHQDGETTVLAPGMNTRLFRELIVAAREHVEALLTLGYDVP